MAKKLNFSFQDVAALYFDLECDRDAWSKSEQWTNDPSSIPRTAADDDGELHIANNAADACLSWSEQFSGSERAEVQLRESVELDVDFPERILSQTRSDLYGATINIREERGTAVEELRRVLTTLKRIKVFSGVTREPRYSRYPVLVWMYAVLFVLIETGINGTILADIVPNGLIGGWSLAFVVSAVNVLIGIMAGLFIPRLWGRTGKSKLRRALAVGFGIFAMVSVLMVNFAVSFVRTHGVETITTDLAGYWNGELQPQNLEALGLLFFGVAVSVLAALKFSTVYDPIPGLQDAHRDMLRLQAQIKEIDQQSPKSLQEQAEIGGGRLEEALEGAHDRAVTFRQSLTTSASNRGNYETGGKRIILVHEQCAERRRSELKSTCPAVPDYWATISPDFSFALPNMFSLADAEKRRAVIDEKLNDIRERTAKAHEKIEEYLRNARSQVELVADGGVVAPKSKDSNVIPMRFKREMVGW
jgi:hypothetical protein